MTTTARVLAGSAKARSNAATSSGFLAVTAFALFTPVAHKASAGVDRCTAPEDLMDLAMPLPRTAARLAQGDIEIGSVQLSLGASASLPATAPPLGHQRTQQGRLRVAERSAELSAPGA